MNGYQKLTKKELIRFVVSRDGTVAHQRNIIIDKLRQTRAMRLRILKIRNSLDYLLKHPYSYDTNYNTKKHPRDHGSPLSKLKKRK